MDPFHILDNLKNQFDSVTFLWEFRNLQCLEWSCDKVACCRFDKWVSSSLIGGCRLLSTLLSVMLSIAVLTNEV